MKKKNIYIFIYCRGMSPPDGFWAEEGLSKQQHKRSGPSLDPNIIDLRIEEGCRVT